MWLIGIVQMKKKKKQIIKLNQKHFYLWFLVRNLAKKHFSLAYNRRRFNFKNKTIYTVVFTTLSPKVSLLNYFD